MEFLQWQQPSAQRIATLNCKQHHESRGVNASYFAFFFPNPILRPIPAALSIAFFCALDLLAAHLWDFGTLVTWRLAGWPLVHGRQTFCGVS